jgi:hypothetical protein
MPRWRILRALLYKEWLRWRAQRGVLVLFAALIGLAALAAGGESATVLSGTEASEPVSACWIVYDGASAGARAWADHLRNHPPTPPRPLEFVDRRQRSARDVLNTDPRVLIIELDAPPWRARYGVLDNLRRGMFFYRNWFTLETRRFLGHPLEPVEESYLIPSAVATADLRGVAVVGMWVFALYLTAFHLYLLAGGEERERRQLLALLLTPARPTELLLAKGLFHGTAGVLLVLALAAVARPALLTDARLPLAAALGAVAYLGLGTVLLAVLRRSATLNVTALAYLLATALVALLPATQGVRVVLFETYLYRVLVRLALIPAEAGTTLDETEVAELLALAGLAAGWTGVGWFLVRRQGPAFGQPR